jgi:hypothetical protein
MRQLSIADAGINVGETINRTALVRRRDYQDKAALESSLYHSDASDAEGIANDA